MAISSEHSINRSLPEKLTLHTLLLSRCLVCLTFLWPLIISLDFSATAASFLTFKELLFYFIQVLNSLKTPISYPYLTWPELNLICPYLTRTWPQLVLLLTCPYLTRTRPQLALLLSSILAPLIPIFSLLSLFNSRLFSSIPIPRFWEGKTTYPSPPIQIYF